MRPENRHHPSGMNADLNDHAAILAQYRQLAACPSRIDLATLDDAGAVAEMPSMPGTIDEYANGRIALPVPAEDLLAAPLARDLLDMLSRR